MTNARRIALTLIALASLSAAHFHAATASGDIRFTGRVFQPASTAAIFDAQGRSELGHITSTSLLSDALAAPHCDALDYFATYAAIDAVIVVGTYD